MQSPETNQQAETDNNIEDQTDQTIKDVTMQHTDLKMEEPKVAEEKVETPTQFPG